MVGRVGRAFAIGATLSLLSCATSGSLTSPGAAVFATSSGSPSSPARDSRGPSVRADQPAGAAGLEGARAAKQQITVPDDLPVATASLEPACVAPGQSLTLTVNTGKPYAGLVYLAWYAGGKTGAPPPWGDGFGGNSGGPSDAAGLYSDTWVVRADAPVGKGRVDVTVVYDSDGSERELQLPFVVMGAEQDEGC